jgi:hypothetical protein
MTTASRRASATIAFFIPRCLAIFITNCDIDQLKSRRLFLGVGPRSGRFLARAKVRECNFPEIRHTCLRRTG